MALCVRKPLVPDKWEQHGDSFFPQGGDGSGGILGWLQAIFLGHPFAETGTSGSWGNVCGLVACSQVNCEESHYLMSGLFSQESIGIVWTRGSSCLYLPITRITRIHNLGDTLPCLPLSLRVNSTFGGLLSFIGWQNVAKLKFGHSQSIILISC